MKRIAHILSRMSIFVSCLFLAISVARVNEHERALVNEGLLPTPVGHLYQQPAYADKVWSELRTVRLEFLNSVMPSYVPAPDKSKPVNPNRLDALKQRSAQRIGS